MYKINKLASNNNVNNNLKALRAEDKALTLELRKVYTNISEKEYTAIPTTSAELLAVYNGKEDITNLNASVLLLSLTFMEEESVTSVEHITIEEVAKEYEDMSVAELTTALFADLGSEIPTQIISMTTGLKVKLDLLDEVKVLLRDNFTDIRPEVLTARLANSLALAKEAKGGALNLVNGNLAVYDYINSDRKVESGNYLFMADINADATASLDVMVLEATFKSYKAQVGLGLLPMPSKGLTLAISKTINGIVELKEDNKDKVLAMKF